MSLTGSGDDPDGTIESYEWTQVSGEPVTLVNADQANASFQAPSTDQELTLTFRLTVTDDTGSTALDDVNVNVIPENAPDVAIHFPPSMSGFTGVDLDVFGSAAVRNADGEDKSITSVTVDAGLGPVDATVENDGSWRAQGVTVPDGVVEFTLTVEATDSAGLSRSTTATTLTTDSDVGEGSSWYKTTALSIDHETDTGYLLTHGTFVRDMKLMPVDLSSGDRDETITRFGDSSYGPTISGGLFDMVLDKANNRVFISAAPEGGEAMIFSVDLTTGQRTIISDSQTDTTVDLVNPVGLALAADGTLWVADNGADAILAVDVSTGERTVIADSLSSDQPVQVPLFLAHDATNSQLFVSPYVTDDPYLLLIDLANSSTTSVFSANSTAVGPDLASLNQDMVADPANNRLLVMNGGHDNLLSIDYSTQARTELAADVTGSYSSTYAGTLQNAKDIGYATDIEVVYVMGGDSEATKDALFAIDPVSGDKVVLSR